jgi:hypothetical protein
LNFGITRYGSRRSPGRREIVIAGLDPAIHRLRKDSASQDSIED